MKQAHELTDDELNAFIRINQGIRYTTLFYPDGDEYEGWVDASGETIGKPNYTGDLNAIEPIIADMDFDTFEAYRDNLILIINEHECLRLNFNKSLMEPSSKMKAMAIYQTVIYK
jgi:hypothetical protein